MKAGVAILILDKDRVLPDQGYFKMIESQFIKRYKTTKFMTNKRASTSMMKNLTELKVKINTSTIILGDIKASLSTDRKLGKNISKIYII